MSAPESLDLACPDVLRRSGTGWTLVGSRCTACGETFFPAQQSCARCCASEQETWEAGCRGSLWSWTIQSFLPKSPFNGCENESVFRPYGVGYIEMPSGLKIESRLTVADPARLSIGMPMELAIEPYRTTTQGRIVHTFAFRPCVAA